MSDTNINSKTDLEKEKVPKTLEEELAELEKDRKFDIGFFIVSLVLWTIFIICRVTGVLGPMELIGWWYSCESCEGYVSGGVGISSFSDVIVLAVMYLLLPLIIFIGSLQGLFYAPYQAFIKLPKEIRALEKEMMEEEE